MKTHALVAARLVLVLAVSMPAFTVHADMLDTAVESPAAIVTETAGKILKKLDESRQAFVDQPELLREVVRTDLLPLIDLEYSARLILGKAGRGVEPQQLTAFSDAMSEVLTNRYADGLLEFRSNEQLQVLPLAGNNTDKLTRVRTRVKLVGGSFAPVDYSFHKTLDGWKAFDVTVEGISYVITFRNQIAPRVEAEGIDKVTADIQAGNIKIDD